MNKKLLLTSLFFVFFSAHKIYADFCESCCLDSVQTLYCPVIADKNAEKCSESCDCCDLTTHNITAVNETRQKCCLKDEKAYWDGDSAECCTGQTYKMTDTDYGCCPKGKELPTNCSVMGPDCKCTECDENYTLSDGKCCAEIDGCVTYGADCKCTKCDESGYFLNDYDECSLKTCDGVEVCDGQQDGTTCCTTDSSDNVVQGLCLGGECEYKQCTGDEKLYVYYPLEYGGYSENPEVNCCTKDPSELPGVYYDGPYSDSQCCTNEKPIYALKGYDQDSNEILYSCFEKEPDFVTCSAYKDTDHDGEVEEDKKLEECLLWADEVGKYKGNGMSTYEHLKGYDGFFEKKYCPNGYTDWKKEKGIDGESIWRRSCN